MKLLSTILRLSLLAVGVGSANAHSAIDADGAVDGAFTPETAAAAALDAEKHSLVTILAGIVAAATPNLRSRDSSFINEEDDSPPLLRGPVKGKDSANLANVNVGEVVDHVDCVDGYTSSDQTCYAACNNGADCCGPTEADNACNRFTGKVAKDGSCMGDDACYGVGSAGGSVGLISGPSCFGGHAYAGACAFAGSNGGAVGDISESCVGGAACAYAGANNGAVGDISDRSCIANYACLKLGWNNGAVGDLAGCCTTVSECLEASPLPATSCPAPTSRPTPPPTSKPTFTPTSTPTSKPTPTPTPPPTSKPTSTPTSRPTPPPTSKPTSTPPATTTTTTTQPPPTTTATTTQATTTTSSISAQQLVINQQPRCGVSELDARERCNPVCAHDGHCLAPGHWCWVVHPNYCGSRPPKQFVEPAQQSTVWTRCGTSEINAREFCGEPCTWQCTKPGESCVGIHSNYCDSVVPE